jgi:hypothetical protein
MLLGPSIILSMLRCLRSFNLPGLIFYFPVDHRCCTQAIISVVLAINDKHMLPVKHFPTSRGFSLLAITFDIILYTTLQMEIGLNLTRFLASFYLGIKVMKVVFMALRIEVEHIESSTMP